MEQGTKIIICITTSVVLNLHYILVGRLLARVSSVDIFVVPMMIILNIGVGIAVYPVLGLERTKNRILSLLLLVIGVVFFQISYFVVGRLL